MVDEFEGELAGLLLVEAEFPSDERMSAFEPPPFAGREITGDSRYTGAALAYHGLPAVER